MEQHIRNINNTIGKTEGWSDNDEIRVRAEDVVLPASIKTLRQYTVYVASDSVHVRAILKSLCEYVHAHACTALSHFDYCDVSCIVHVHRTV